MNNATRFVLAPAVALTCLAGLAGLAGPAVATPTVSRVVITSATSDTEHVHVRGKVVSEDKDCKGSRVVKIYHDTGPHGPDRNDYLIGTVRTTGKGRWALHSVELPDKVYAVLKKRGGCTGDASPTEDVVAVTD